MAFFHLEAKVITRSVGRSAVAASAYASCSKMCNDYDGVQHDYTRKRGCRYSEVFLPSMANPEWRDRECLWNAVEEAEKTKDSRLAREMIVALPKEFSIRTQQEVLRKYIAENFTSEGICVDVSLHDGNKINPHAHLLLTVRPLNADGTWQYKTEKEYLCVKNNIERGFTAEEYKSARKDGWEKQYPYKVDGKKVYLPSSVAEVAGYKRMSKYPKSTRYGRQNPIAERWNSEEQLVAWRKAWADVVNCELERLNYAERIDHRSHAERGLLEKPTIHEGVMARMMEQEGKISERCEINRQIRAENKMIREIKKQIAILSEKLQNSIPIIAESLENIRAHLILMRYGLRSYWLKIQGVNDTLNPVAKMLKEYQKIKLLIKEKTTERKALNAQKKNTGILEVKKHIELNNQITTLTENIEELKSQRQMILKKLKCNDEKDIGIIENKRVTLQQKRDELQNQCEIILGEIAEEKTRYKEIIGQVSAEDMPALAEEQHKIRGQKRSETVAKLKDLYNDGFSKKLFTEAEKAVDVRLAGKVEEKQKESVLKKLQENKKKVEQRNGQQERQKNPPAKKKARGSELF